MMKNRESGKMTRRKRMFPQRKRIGKLTYHLIFYPYNLKDATQDCGIYKERYEWRGKSLKCKIVKDRKSGKYAIYTYPKYRPYKKRKW